MSIRSTMGIDQYRSGDAHIYISHHLQRLGITRTPVIYSPGYSTNARLMLQYTAGSRQLIRTLGGMLPTLGIDAGGTDTFGNDVAISAIGQAVSWFGSTYGAQPPFLLVGTSMGFADILAWGRANQSQVIGAIGVVGLTDLTAASESTTDMGNGQTAGQLVDAAYGGNYNPTTHGPTHDPTMYASTLGS